MGTHLSARVIPLAVYKKIRKQNAERRRSRLGRDLSPTFPKTMEETGNCRQKDNMKIGIYCYLNADILTKVFSEMFVEWSSTKHILFVQTIQFVCHGNQKAKFVKYINESTSPKLYGALKR